MYTFFSLKNRFPHWWHLPFTNSDHKRFRDLNHYMEQILTGSYEIANVCYNLILYFCIKYRLLLEICYYALWWHSVSPSTNMHVLCVGISETVNCGMAKKVYSTLASNNEVICDYWTISAARYPSILEN